MSSGSKIEWTEVTWNPTTGCDRISPGCDHLCTDDGEAVEGDGVAAIAVCRHALLPEPVNTVEEIIEVPDRWDGPGPKTMPLTGGRLGFVDMGMQTSVPDGVTGKCCVKV